jgi:hypothetical protein
MKKPAKKRKAKTAAKGKPTLSSATLMETRANVYREMENSVCDLSRAAEPAMTVFDNDRLFLFAVGQLDLWCSGSRIGITRKNFPARTKPTTPAARVRMFGGRVTQTLRKAMPAKQTKEAIEAELNASERERIALQLQDVLNEFDEVEKQLRTLEDEHGIPEFARSRPLPERMAAIGMRQATIERISTFLDALEKVRQGRISEVPDHVKSELADQADAELSGAEQLAAIVDQQRRGS